MSFSSVFSFLNKVANQLADRAEQRQELYLKFKQEFSNKSPEQLLEIMRRNPEGSVEYLVAQELKNAIDMLG